MEFSSTVALLTFGALVGAAWTHIYYEERERKLREIILVMEATLKAHEDAHRKIRRIIRRVIMRIKAKR